MRKFIMLGFLLAGAAAQAQLSEPKSDNAGNILNGSKSVANELPAPQALSDGVVGMLTAAVTALRAHHTGEAQEALEQAETMALSRSVPKGQGSMPITDPLISDISQARWALGEKNIPASIRNTETALAWAKAH